MSEVYIIVIHSFNGYAPFIVIIKYWLSVLHDIPL